MVKREYILLLLRPRDRYMTVCLRNESAIDATYCNSNSTSFHGPANNEQTTILDEEKSYEPRRLIRFPLSPVCPEDFSSKRLDFRRSRERRKDDGEFETDWA